MTREKSKCLAVIILTLLFLVSCGSNKEIVLNEEIPTPDFAHDYPVGEISMYNYVEQTFTADFDSIRELELYGATYIRHNEGTVIVKIYCSDEPNIYESMPEDRILIVQWNLDASKMDDNSIINLSTDANAEQNDALISCDVNTSENRNLDNKYCIIEISSPDSEPGSSVTFWSTAEDVYQDGCLYVNGFEQYNDLWFKIYGNR